VSPGWSRSLSEPVIAALVLTLLQCCMADDDKKPKPKQRGIPLGQWSGSDATDALHDTIRATGRQNTWLLRMTAIIVALAVLSVVVPIYLAYFPPHQPIERRLTDKQITNLGTEAAKFKSDLPEIFVAFVNGDREAEQYQHDFADAFRRVGIATVLGWTDTPDAGQVGVIIAVKDAGLILPQVRQLRGALQSIGISPQVRSFPAAGFGPRDRVKDFVLYIAPRPL